MKNEINEKIPLNLRDRGKKLKIYKTFVIFCNGIISVVYVCVILYEFYIHININCDSLFIQFFYTLKFFHIFLYFDLILSDLLNVLYVYLRFILVSNICNIFRFFNISQYNNFGIYENAAFDKLT